jgi:SAM-dependent methyltransferase
VHEAAWRFVERVATVLPRRRRVVEFGSYNVNGSVRGLFPGAWSIGVDARPGVGVDVVADASQWQPLRPVDCVACCEVLEYCAAAEQLCHNAHSILSPGGVFVVTCASELRAPHGVDGGEVGGQFYRGVIRAELLGWLAPFDLVLLDPRAPPEDLYVAAWRVT